MSLLDKYRIDFEYNESYPDILKTIRRARRARKQRREAQMAKANNRKPSVNKKETK